MKKTFLVIIMLFLSTLAQAQTWQQLDSLGQALTKKQKFKAADSVLQIALKKVEAQHGKDTSYAKVARNLGTVYFYMADYKKAEIHFLESKNIRAALLGNTNLDYATSCNSLGILYRVLGNYKKAELFYLEAKTIRQNRLGKRNSDYANSCNSLAIFYSEQGQYGKAELLLLEAQDITESLHGKKHLFYANSCNNLANLYKLMGYYKKVEELYHEAMQIIESNLGQNNLQYADACNNMAILYAAFGLYDKAELYYLRVQKIRLDKLGTKHIDYANSSEALGNLYLQQKIFDKAEIYFQECKDIRTNTFTEKHSSVVRSYQNLANLHLLSGNINKAKEFADIAESIMFQIGEYDMISHIGVRQIQADVHEKYGDKKRAEEYLLSSLESYQKIFGIENSQCVNTYWLLGEHYRRNKDSRKSEEFYCLATRIKKDEILDIFPSLSEQEKQAYWRSIRYCFESFTQFCNSYGNENPVIMADLYDQTLFTKGIIFSSTQKIKNTILNSGDTVLVNQYNNWKKQRESYTKLYQLPLEEQKKQNLDLEGMKNQINDLEKDLSKKSALFGQNVQTKSYKWQEVKAKLAKNEVVIEIIKSDSAYIALFLTAQTENYPAFYLFKNAQELEDKFLNYYKNCIEFKIEDTVSYNAFWKPIADKLSTLNKKGFKKIYFSPDGVFHQLSLNTLKNTKTGKFLLEEANIQLIGSSRDLIELNKKSRDLSQNYENYQAHLLGYPIYGAENTEKEPEKKRDRSLGFSGMQSAVGVAGAVSLLPGTKKEVENVFGLFNQKKLKVNLLLAENATEEAVKNLKSPTILHVATHGFFIPEISDKEVKSIQDAMNRNLLKNPFMRSGLLLAGCQKPNPEGEDGILTAEEVMNLTLDNTELVVMSACETGLGDIQAGEGVFGLQRAFQQAGAKSVLMSLWKVDDEATQTLMTEFYTALLKGQSKRQAFKTAQMNLKKRFPEPYYWGAFVMVGE